MKTDVAETSIAAYRALDLPTCKRRVVSYLTGRTCCSDRQIAQALGEVPGWASARRNELIAAGLVEYAGRQRCAVTGKTVKTHRLVASQSELELI